MSLIHKALKRADGSEPPNTGENDMSGGQQRSGNGGAGRRTVSFPPRTIALLVVLWIAGGGAIYWRFFHKPAAPVKPANPQVTIETVQPGAPPPASNGAAVTAAPDAAVPTATPLEKKADSASTDETIPADVAPLIKEGESLFEAKKYPAAVEKFLAATQKQPKVATLWNDLGMARKQANDLKGAEEAYQKAIELKPNFPEALNNFGMLKYVQNDHLTAAYYYHKATEQAATYADAHFNLAVLMEEEGNWRSAVEEYKLFLQHTTNADAELIKKVELRVEEIAP